MNSTVRKFAPLFICCFTPIVTSACSESTEQHQPPATEVGYVTMRAEPVTVTSELTGRTTATTVAEVRPQVDGIIQARLFEEGSIVHQGQPLYQIDARLYRASLDEARAQLESAQASLASDEAKARRYRNLADKDAVSAQDYDETVAAARASRAAVQQYQATSRSAAVNLQFTRVLAPITGRIGRSSVTKGALVQASQSDALATIRQLDPIYVDLTQSAVDLLKLRQSLRQGNLLPTSAEVSLKLEDGTEYDRKGTIEFSEVDVDTQAGTVTIRARFPNPDSLLLPGMFVRVTAPQGRVENGILAPQQGVTRDAKGNATALVVGKNNKVEQRKLTLGQAMGNKWLVTGGLKAGDKLIVEGAGKVQQGSSVKPVETRLAD